MVPYYPSVSLPSRLDLGESTLVRARLSSPQSCMLVFVANSTQLALGCLVGNGLDVQRGATRPRSLRVQAFPAALPHEARSRRGDRTSGRERAAIFGEALTAQAAVGLEDRDRQPGLGVSGCPTTLTA